jgi:hypothetical protein
MTITREHARAPQQDSTTTAAPAVSAPARRRPGLLAILGEAVAAARAVSTADARTSVAVAERFAARV